MHHQPQRLVRSNMARSLLSADRLQGIDGLGNLAAVDADGEPLGTQEDELESDSDYSWLVKSIIKAAGAITPAALNLAGTLAKKKGIDVNAILGLAQGRAQAVQQGTASMPTGAWIGIGVGVAALLGILFVSMGRRSNPYVQTKTDEILFCPKSQREMTYDRLLGPSDGVVGSWGPKKRRSRARR